MKQWIVTLTLLTGLLCSLGASGQSGKYYVKAGASGAGASWADASGSLQDMINAAAAGDEIWVAAGTYKPGSLPGGTGTIGARDAAFVLKEGVKIYGGFNGTETALSQRNVAANITILSGDIGIAGDASDNLHHVVISVNNTNATLLDGFTITGGNANGEGTVVVSTQTIIRTSGGGIFTRGSSAVFNQITVKENRSETTTSNGNGGGIYSINSSIKITASVISGNAADAPLTAGGTGGGIYIAGNADSINNVSLTDVTVTGNSCKNSGAGIFVTGFSDPVLENIVISENNASANAGGMIVIGNVARNNNATLNNVSFLKNKALGGRAGGLFLSIYTTSTLTDITFTENTSSALAGAMYGVGAAARASSAVIENIRFLRNQAGGAAGAMYVDTLNNYTITNAEFTENKATGSGGALFVVGASNNFNKFSIKGATFSKNTATASGGAAYMSSYTNYKLGNTYFLENTATAAGGALFLFSGGAAAPNTDANVYNSVFYGNEAKHATLGGGGIFVSNNTRAGISGCTFYENKSVATGGAVGVNNSATAMATVTNTIFYGNTSNGAVPDIGAGANAVLTLTHSLTQSTGTNGVDGLLVGADPLFASTDPANTTHFLRLLEASPAKNAGDNASVPADADKDLAGNDRILDGTVDIGAFEFINASGPSKTQTIQFADITKTYGDDDFSTAEASSGLTVSYEVSDNTVATVVDGKIHIVGAGTTNITATQPGNFEYMPADAVIRVLTVNKAPLTIKTNDATMVQGDPLPEFTASYTGFVLGENEEVLTTKPVYTTTATSSSPEGEYEVMPSGAAAANYEITYEPGKLTMLLSHPAGKIRYVKPAASGTGSGLSWADASNDLQAMINASDVDGEVWVAAGTYKPASLTGSTGSPGERDVAFVLKSGVKVYGGFKGTEVRLSDRDIQANPTILSGDIGTPNSSLDNAYHVVLSINNTANTVLDGFTITGGHASGNGNSTVHGKSISQLVGGGVYVDGSDQVVFGHLTITDNQMTGAGIGGGGIYIKESKTEFRNSIIDGNLTTGSGGTYGSGAGFFVIGAESAITEVKFTGTVIKNNVASRTGGGGYVHNYCRAEFNDVTFENNSANEAGALQAFGVSQFFTVVKANNTRFLQNKATVGNGGAILGGNYVNIELNQVTASENTAVAQGGMLYTTGNISSFNNLVISGSRFDKNRLSSNNGIGGALSVASYVNCRITNTEFLENESPGSAGAIAFGGSTYSRSNDVYVINSVFYGNKSLSATGGGAAINTGVDLTSNIINCTFYNNQANNQGGAIRTINNVSVETNIINCIFLQNQGLEGKDIYLTERAKINLKHSYTQEAGTHGVNGVIVGTDPGFVSTDPSNSDFLRLSSTSEAIDKGDNAALPAGITTDIAGNQRIEYAAVDMGAYEFAGPQGQPTIPQTITFTGNITKTYGDASFSAGATASSGLPVTYTSSNPAVAIISNNNIQITGAGTADITATQRGDDQYMAAPPVSVTLTVNKASLTIKPNDVSVEQGATLPVFTATYTGLVNGDTEGSLTTPPTITTTATSVSPLGQYPLTASGAATNNYNITYLPGTLTIIAPVRVPAEKIAFEAWFSSSTELQVKVDMTHAQTATLAVYSNSGIPVYGELVELLPGTNSFVIKADRLLPGVYIVNIKGSGLRFDKKIIKR